MQDDIRISRFLAVSGIREASTQETMSFLEVRRQAHRIETLYTDSGLILSPNCSLAILLAKAKALADREEAGKANESTMNDVFFAIHVERIADSVLRLSDVPDRRKYLTPLMSGEMDFFVRRTSHAKNIFWEIELFNTLLKLWPSTALADPPDITLELHGARLGISCKKIYSEKNVEKVLSNAVMQVTKGFDAGIVALNIDDLTPADSVVKVRSSAELTRFLANKTDEFIRRHQRCFRKYLSTGRLVSALVTLNVTADILDGNPRFISAREMTFWTIPLSDTNKMAIIEKFRGLVIGADV